MRGAYGVTLSRFCTAILYGDFVRQSGGFVRWISLDVRTLKIGCHLSTEKRGGKTIGEEHDHGSHHYQ